MTAEIRVEVAGRTHVGLVRRRNEDSLYTGRSLVAVADGLGGHVAGDVASTTVIETLRGYDVRVPQEQLPTNLGRAVSAANEALRHRITADPAVAGMGTTVVAMLWSGPVAVLANVGDSRAYVRRGHTPGRDRTVLITEDHTYEHLVSDAADVPLLPARLSRFLDGRPDGRSPDLTIRELRPGDRYLLCSDGLSSFVPHLLLDAALDPSYSAGQAAEQLIAAALERGGPDNVTVIVVDIHPSPCP